MGGDELTLRREHGKGKMVPFDLKQFPKRLELVEFCPVEISPDNLNSVSRTQMMEESHHLPLVVF